MDNLEEADEFLEKYNFPKLNQEEIWFRILTDPSQARKSKLQSKISQQTRAQNQMDSQVNFTKSVDKN